MLHPLRRSLLSLPPSLRTSIYQSQQSRSFSASATRKSPLTEAVLYGPTLLLDTIHSTGLPWHTAIPLSALLVRTILVYHLSALPARKAAIIRTNLYPLSAARSSTEFRSSRAKILDSVRAFAEAGGDARGLRNIAWHIRIAFMKRWIPLKNSHKLGKEFGAPVWSWWRSPMNLGVLIAMTEALRVKCGAREGLLSTIIRPFDSHVDAETARRAAMTPDEIMVERLEAANAAREAASKAQTGNEVGEPVGDTLQDTASAHLAPLNTNAYASLQDPTLKTEGLSWCPDLTLIDSTLILPVALASTMILNVMARPAEPHTPSSNSLSKSLQQEVKQPASKDMPDDPIAALQAHGAPRVFLSDLTFRQRMGLTLSLLFFFAALKLPVAVLLYLMPSIAFGWLQNRWLDLKYPLPEVVTACRRPVRMKVRKEFRNA